MNQLPSLLHYWLGLLCFLAPITFIFFKYYKTKMPNKAHVMPQSFCCALYLTTIAL